MKKIHTMIVALFAFAPIMCAWGGGTAYSRLYVKVSSEQVAMGKVYASDSSSVDASLFKETSEDSYKMSGNNNIITLYAHAQANVGYDFVGWSETEGGEIVSQEATCSADIKCPSTPSGSTDTYNSPDVCRWANFKLTDYPAFQVTFKTVEPAEAGSYTVDSGVVDAETVLPAVPTNHLRKFNLAATPSSDYLFVRWYLDGTGETISTDATATYPATNNVTVGAEFRLKNDVVIHFQPTGVDGVSYKIDNADTVSSSVVDKTYERAETKKVTLTLTGSYSKQPRWWFRTTGSEEKVYWTYAKSPSRTFEGEVDVGVDFFNPEDCNLVAQVGDEPFDSLADAVKAWGPGKTLKLLANVTSTETVVVTVNSKNSQNWFLELGDYVWTANGCDAIQVYACGDGQINQNYGLKVYANQQGGITATSNTCIKCVYEDTTFRYRPRIEVHGGIYNGNYVIFYSDYKWSDGPNLGCSTWLYASSDGSSPVFNGNFALYKCPLNIYSGFFNGDNFHHYIVSSTADVYVHGGSFKNMNAMPAMNGAAGAVKIIFPDNIVLYVDEDGRYNVIPESSVPSISYEAVSAAYNDTRFSAYIDGQNRYKDFYWADADLAIPNIDKVFYRTITLCENVAATADTTVSTGNANPPCTLDVTAEGASYSGTVKISGSSAKFVIKGQSANVVCGVAKYVVSCAADEENKVYTYSLVSAAASVTVGSTTTYYRTLPDAISAATEAGVTEITILNGATESPDPAWVVQEGKLVYSPAAAQIGDEEFATFAEAIAAAEAYKAEHGSYPTITVLNGATEQENPDWKIADGKLVHKVYIAQIGSAGYETLADAVAAVPVGGEEATVVQMIADVAVDNSAVLATIPANKKVALDLNGKSITCTGNFPAAFNLILVRGELTVGDTSAKANGSISLTSTANLSWDYAVNMFLVGNNGKLTVEGGNFTVSTPSYGYAEYVIAASNNEASSDVVINGGTFVGNNIDAIVRLHDQYGRSGHLAVTITGGDFTLNGNACDSVIWFDVQNSGSGTDNASDARLAISGGTFVSTSGSPAIDFGHSVEASGLRAEITGGTFVSMGKVFKTRELAAAIANIKLSGGYFSGVECYNDKTKENVDLNTLCVEGKMLTTRVNTDELYEVVAAKTVTYSSLGTDAPADAVLPAPASFVYPSGDMAEIALANPTYTSTDKSFAGWQVSGTDDVISSIPAGSTTDFTLVATWTSAKTVTITESATTVPIKVTDEWIGDNVTPADEEATTAEIQEALNKKDANGLKAWENYVLGLDGSDPNANVAADAAQGPVSAMPVTSNVDVPTVDTGFTVEYKLVSVDTNGTTVAEIDTQATPDLKADIASMTSETNVVYYKTVAVITSTTDDSVSVTVASTNTIGVLKVESAATITAIAVPWESLGGGDISVSNIVRTANLTSGDELKAYAPDGSGYKAWTLNESKEWEPNITATKTDSSVAPTADDFKVKRGSAVWLKRADPSQPIYLVGGVAESKDKVEVTLDPAKGENDPSWNLVGSSGTEPVDVTALLGENHADKVSVPTAYVPKNYEYVDGKGWGYWDSETYAHTNKAGRVSMRVRDVFVTDDKYIPAGTGFWYQNSGGEKNIDL